MSVSFKIGVATSLMVAIGGSARAQEQAQRVDLNQLYATNTVCLADNKVYSVGAVLNKLRCGYRDTMLIQPGDHPPAPPEWELIPTGR